MSFLGKILSKSNEKCKKLSDLRVIICNKALFIMKSVFPLKPELEDHLFDDPDKKFNSLKFSMDIPEPFSEGHKLPPLNLEVQQAIVPRQQGSATTFISFLLGWYYLGNRMVVFKYGNSITRWRSLWISLAGGCLAAISSVSLQGFYDFSFSTHAGGRRRGMFYEETVRHSLNAKFGLYENIDKIMMAKDRITREEFYEVMVRNYEKTVEEYKGK